MGILVALVLLPRIFGLRLGDPYRVFVLVPYLGVVFSSISILSGFSIYGYVTISSGMHSFLCSDVKTICCNFNPLDSASFYLSMC